MAPRARVSSTIRRACLTAACCALVASAFRSAVGEAVTGTSSNAEFLSALTRSASTRFCAGSKGAPDGGFDCRLVGADGGRQPEPDAVERQASDSARQSRDARNASSPSAVVGQVTTALGHLDLGLGVYPMCPFPFSYLHACDTSSQCPASDCCGMYAFPGPTRWRRSCCVPNSVTTIARVARLCINSDARPSLTDWLRLGMQLGVAVYSYAG